MPIDNAEEGLGLRASLMLPIGFRSEVKGGAHASPAQEPLELPVSILCRGFILRQRADCRGKRAGKIPVEIGVAAPPSTHHPLLRAPALPYRCPCDDELVIPDSCGNRKGADVSTAAEARITDASMAADTAAIVRHRILQEAVTAILA